jgi:hypothetical protein
MTRALLVLFAVACSSTKPSGPSPGTYTITFPSTAAAIATDSVEVLIFEAGADASAFGNMCGNLVQMRKSNQQLPAPLLQPPAASPCDLLAGTGTVTLTYGERAVLAVAMRGGKDFLIGCQVENVNQNSELSPIDLALIDPKATVPPTTCTKLSLFCQHGC